MRKTTKLVTNSGKDTSERESGSRVSFSLSHVASLGLVFVLLVGFTIILYQIKVEPLGWLIPVVVVASIVPIVLIVLHLVGLPFPFWVSYLGSSSAAADVAEEVEDGYDEEDYYYYPQDDYEESSERTARRSAAVGAGHDYGKGLGARNTSTRNLTTTKIPMSTPTPKGTGTVSEKGSASIPVPQAILGGSKPRFKTPTRIYMVNRAALAPVDRNQTLLDIVTQEATRHCLERYLPADGGGSDGGSDTAAHTNPTNQHQPDAKRRNTDFDPTF
jgi:hypothetical protein